MKCYKIDEGEGLNKLKLTEISEPVLLPGQVKIQWHATTLNYHDYLVSNGSIPVDKGRIPMSDGAGVIVETGEGVTKWKKGDKVMSLFFPNWIKGIPSRENTRAISGESVDGYACEYSCLGEEQVTRIPRGYSYGEAATLPCAALTAWRALQVEGKIRQEDIVLAEGTGGMSIFAIQLAKMTGAKVVATTGSNNKIDRLKALGVEEIVNYKEVPAWGKSIYKLTDGGADHVIDIGGNTTMRQSIEAVSIYGNIYSIGILGGPKGEILFPKLFFKQIHLIGLAVGSGVMQEKMVAAIELSGIKPVIDKSFDLNELGDAFRYQESGAHFGKIVVEW